MALDPVPWVIGDVAEHGPDVARQLAYLAVGGKEGIGLPGDLKVSALNVPGAGVQVAGGAASILNRVSSQQAYTARNPTADTTSVKIAATGSSAGRSDLVVLQVDNPYIDGNAQAPTDPVKGPYNRFVIYPGVPAGCTRLQDIAQYAGVSAITLARIDLPKSTGTVTNAMITDLRNMANPRSQRRIKQTQISAASSLSSADYVPFPALASTPDMYFDVPSWAIAVNIRVSLNGVYVDTGATSGNLRAVIGPGGNQVASAPTYFNESEVSQTRRLITIEDTVDIRSSLRGGTQAFTLQGYRSGGAGRLVVQQGAQIFWDVEFIESTE